MESVLYNAPSVVPRTSSFDGYEAIYHATRLCQCCFRAINIKIPTLLLSSKRGRRPFEHQTSYDDLRRSANTGCRICRMTLRNWTRQLKSAGTPGGQHVSRRADKLGFYFMEQRISKSVLIGVQSFDEDARGDGPRILDLVLHPRGPSQPLHSLSLDIVANILPLSSLK